MKLSVSQVSAMPWCKCKQRLSLFKLAHSTMHCQFYAFLLFLRHPCRVYQHDSVLTSRAYKVPWGRYHTQRLRWIVTSQVIEATFGALRPLNLVQRTILVTWYNLAYTPSHPQVKSSCQSLMLTAKNARTTHLDRTQLVDCESGTNTITLLLNTLI